MKRLILTISAIIFFAFGTVIPGQDLNPGDGVRIIFYNINEEISGDYFIQLDGKIQLPYLGLIPTHERGFPEIKQEIEAKYSELYKNPEITVQPLYRINILGEVNNPGFYYVTGIEKLSGLLAMAGGETSDADIEDIYLVRDDQEIEVDAKEILKSGGTVEDIGLQSGDRVYVPREWWVSARNTTFLISGVAVLVTLVSLFIR